MLTLWWRRDRTGRGSYFLTNGKYDYGHVFRFQDVWASNMTSFFFASLKKAQGATEASVRCGGRKKFRVSRSAKSRRVK